ncbi:MAG: BLUF domain-containing protein [Methylococcales bacterium]|nr:BLUF domain-containing protein [Methylococcales bacterium]MDP3838677.1 BLUF domain-containing protein [Methylococcales bacterium]
MSLYCLVYVSIANQEMSDKHLEAMLKKARPKNEKAAITGMLLYRDGFFIQALEGELETIENLYTTIAKDERHRDVILVYKNSIQQRRFSDWTMGFNRLDATDTNVIDGYTRFLQQPQSAFFIDYADEVEDLLNRFKP